MKIKTIEPGVLTPGVLTPNFDQVVQGNVDIKQLSKNKYKITFSEIRKFLLYQVWSNSSQQLNENRKVFYQNVKAWIKNFNRLNDSLKAFNKPLFTPTTVMEIGNKKYIFVLNKVKINSNGHVVFKVSTKEIKSSDKKLLKLPRGHHDGVRFDIDRGAYANYCGNAVSCTCAQILQYQLSTFNENCKNYVNCDSASSPYNCLYANILGCGNKYSWSNNSVDVIAEGTTTSYCPQGIIN
jgi:hypothetical protein